MLTENDTRIAKKLTAAGHPEAVGKFLACSRKKSHPNLIDAMNFARQTAPKDGSYRARIYKCSHCSGFHLTTKTKSQMATEKSLSYLNDKVFQEMRIQRDKAISELVKVRDENERLKNAPVVVISEKKSWWVKLKESMKGE